MSHPPFDPPGHPPIDNPARPPYAQSDGPFYPGYLPPAQSPAKKRDTRKTAFVILAGLAAAAGIAAVAYAFNDHAEKTADHQSTMHTHVVEPKTLGGRPKNVNAAMRRLTDRGVADLKKLVPHATGTVVAFYGNLRNKDMVMILGVSAPVSDPGATSKGFAAGMGTKVGRMKRIQPGPLGGVAQCGDAAFVANVTSGVCTWADGDTRGMIVTYFESGDRAARDFVKMRNEIERRG